MRPVVVGRLVRTLAAGRTRVKVKLPARTRRALARVHRMRVRVVVRVTDAAGNTAARTAHIVLRR